MAYRLMQENHARYTVREMAGLFGVSRSAYYQWAGNGASNRREEADAELARLIREIVTKHCRRYGSPRVRRELREACGKRVSLKKAARLMRENGLNARRRRKFIPTTDSKHGLAASENILNREFHAEKGGQKRVSGIAYLRAESGRVYLTVALDLFDRNIVGWALSGGMGTAETVIAALEMAVKNRGPQNGLLFHSGRGFSIAPNPFAPFCVKSALRPGRA